VCCVCVLLGYWQILSQKDLLWQGGPEYADAIGFVVMRLTGDKSGCHAFAADKMAGMSRTFAPARSVSASLTLGPGRYAVVPCQFKPGTADASFMLEVYAELPVRWEVQGEDLPDLDGEAGSDADDDAATAFAAHEEAAHEPHPESRDRGLLALQQTVADLALQLRGLGAEIADLEAQVQARTA
jgi:hypothetical protein